MYINNLTINLHTNYETLRNDSLLMNVAGRLKKLLNDAICKTKCKRYVLQEKTVLADSVLFTV